MHLEAALEWEPYGVIGLMLPSGRTPTMRWTTNHRHDPRYIDLLVVLALVIVISSAWRLLSWDRDNGQFSGLIVPSQTTRW